MQQTYTLLYPASTLLSLWSGLRRIFSRISLAACAFLIILAMALFLTAIPCPGQTLNEQRQMQQVLTNLASHRPEAEQQVDWEALEVRQAPGLPRYQDLNTLQQDAFRKAFLTTMAQKPLLLRDLPPRRQNEDYFLGRYRFRKTDKNFKLTGIL